jgi:hypothetical protein
MFRTGFIACLVLLSLLSCKNKKSTTNEKGFSYEKFSELFRPLSLPYELSDIDLANNKDTTVIRSADFANLISDSTNARLFGKGAKVKYIAIGRMKLSSESNFYLVKASGANKKAALLLAFSGNEYSTMLPFLVPDADPSTSQVSIIDKSFGITKNITQKKTGNLTAEGKDVYGYDPSTREFSLVLTNPLNASEEIINPIDSFPRKHKFAGDYVKDKKNFISVRDGRYPNQLLVFMHLDQNDGTCTGELKGDILLTSPTSAIYRQGGDPCVLTLHFSSSSVTIKEDEGCGSHRGLDCTFDGTFNRKKEKKQKPAKKTAGK